MYPAAYLFFFLTALLVDSDPLLVTGEELLASTEKSPGLAAGDHNVLNALDRLHVLCTLEGRWIGAADLTHAALHLLDRFVFVLFHPLPHSRLDVLKMFDAVS